ncbi:MAG TPA: dienelactone hydrolase family protein [Roseiflexaceae bacterium]|nr:dienelactone hydrolase family protein [Roseiflexaceae bacterium]
MRLLKRIVLWVLAIVLGTVVFLAGSVLVDALIGRGRVDALANTRIARGNGPEISAYVARPIGPGPHPAVIMIHEFWGLRPDIVGKAAALAEQGYVVIAPDVFRGASTGWVPRAIYQVVTTPEQQVNDDLNAVFEWLVAQPDVQPDRIAIMGFCFGGGTSLRYSLSNSRLAATAVFYGSTITDPNRLKALPGPLLGIFGGADVSIPVADVRAMQAALDQAGVPNQISIYDGQQHGFVKSIEEINQGGPQQQAWNELLAFLDQNLKSRPASSFSPAPRQTAQPNAQGILAAFAPARIMHVFVCDRTVRMEA